MPTKEYSEPFKAWQALTDEEIENDQKEIPVAVITVPGLQKIKITQLCEWDYYNTFIPMRNKFVNYYANKFARDENIKDSEILLAKIKMFNNDILSMAKENAGKPDGPAAPESLSYLFSDENVRISFFKDLKKLGLIKWWVSWKRWQKHVRVLDTITIFSFLMLFNLDGVKKNAKFLIDRISRVMVTALPIESKVFTDLESFKKAHAAAHLADPWVSRNNSNN